MKAQILKIAGVKNEKEFYKKFPTEEAFIKKHGKELKKAQVGIALSAPKQMAVNAPALPTLKNTFSSTPGFGATAKAYAKNVGNDILKGVKGAIEPADITTPTGLAGMIGGIGAGIQQINDTDKAIKQNKLYGKVSDVVLQAQGTREERPKNKYDTTSQLAYNANPLGTGTNYLAAANGAMIGGNPTEIQNMYTTPDTMYTDLGYEPLNNSNPKQYKKGGKLKKAQAGEAVSIGNTLADVSKASGQLGGFLGGQWSGTGGETGGYTKALSSFGLAGGILGGWLDAPQIKEKQQSQAYLNNNNALMQGQNQIQGFQQEKSAFVRNGGDIESYEEGGWVSHDWQPQVIAKFGENRVSDLLKPPHDADMLRAGGHLKYYTPPSLEAMNTDRAEYGAQMAMGGDLKVLDGGYAETISYNPYMPGTGETVMFKGRSHDNGGIPIQYGQNGVEVEGGEPMYQMEDGGQVNDTSGIVAGNMIINKFAAENIGDLKAKDRKYKHVVADYAKVETKANKTIEKAMTLANKPDASPLDLSTAQALEIGGKDTLKIMANKKMNLAAMQNAFLDTAKEYGLESDALSKNKIKYAKANDPYAKFGAKLTTAQSGTDIDPNDKWINKILDYESKRGSGAGTGLSNFGYNDWEKFGHPNAPRTKQEAIDYFKKDYLPRVANLPEGLRERMGDWVYNTGKDPRIPLLLAAGKVKSNAFGSTTPNFLGVVSDRLELANNPALLEERWNEHSAEILKKAKDPEFLKKVDTAKKIMYQNINKPAADKINPAYKNTWKGRTDMFSDDIQPIVQQAPVTQASIAQQAPIAQAKQLGRIDDEEIIIENKNVRKQAPVPVPVPDPRYSASSSQFPSPTDEEGNYYMPITQEEQQSPIVKALQSPTYYSEDYEYKGDVTGKKPTGSGNWVGDLLTTGLRAAYPFLRSYPMNDLDPSQLNPEYLAASMNQQDPVYAQSYQPLLAQATSYSLQDQLNEITSASRAAEKMSAYNPEAAAMIAAGSYGAKNKVLGEQFRLNQAGQADVINQNRATLNDAQFKNLGIFQDQADKTAKAKSNTKATSIEIAKNIAAKYAQNKAENKQMNVASNMFPAFDFNQNGTIYKNPFYAASFANQGMPKNPGMFPGVFDEESLPQSPIPGYKYKISLEKTKDKVRNGAIVKAIKNL